jgi:hypothetical protein
MQVPPVFVGTAVQETGAGNVSRLAVYICLYSKVNRGEVNSTKSPSSYHPCAGSRSPPILANGYEPLLIEIIRRYSYTLDD